VLAIVARQQGKSLLMRVLILYWMFVEQQPMTLATSTDRSYAKKAWSDTCDAAKDNPHLAAELPPRPQVLQVGEEEFRNIHGAKYRFAATNRRAGRSLSIDRLVLDEIREHANFDAWGASTNAMNARPAAQCIAVSNQGDDTSVVLDDLRNGAQHFIDTGEGDPRRGLFEWSAPSGSDPLDLRALALANPSLGRRTDADSLLGAARSAVKAGGEQLTRTSPRSCASAWTSSTPPTATPTGRPAAPTRPSTWPTIGDGSHCAWTCPWTALTPPWPRPRSWTG
jgi:phage terminase large subunit-like protein